VLVCGFKKNVIFDVVRSTLTDAIVIMAKEKQYGST